MYFVAWWHINVRGLFNAEAILIEEQWLYYLTHWLWNKGVHAFPKGISPKVKVWAWLKFDLSYYDLTVQHISRYATEVIPLFESCSLFKMVSDFSATLYF